MILVLIKKTQATTQLIRGRNIEDENGAGHRQGNKPIVGAGHCCRASRHPQIGGAGAHLACPCG